LGGVEIDKNILKKKFPSGQIHLNSVKITLGEDIKKMSK
jgi:hypothetical protein